MAKDNEATLLLRIKEIGGEILDHFVITLGDVKDLIEKIPEFLMEAINAFREQELAINQLTQSMINQGTFTQDLKLDYLEMAEALQKVTTFSDDQIMAAQATLQAYIGQKTVTEELVKATLNLAAGKRIDLAAAADIVGKTIGSETDALRKQGVVVKEASNQNEKLGNVIEAVNKKFGGQAEAAAQGLGSIDQLKNSWENFLINIGRLMAPVVVLLTEGAKGVLNFFNSFAGADLAAQKTEEIKSAVTKLIDERNRLEKSIASSEAQGHENAGKIALLNQLNSQIEAHKNALKTIEQNEKISGDNRVRIQAENYDKLAIEHITKNQARIEAQSAIDLAELTAVDSHSATILQAKMKLLDVQIEQETDFHKKRQLMQAKASAQEQLTEQQKNEALLKHRAAFLSQVSSLQSSSNKTLAAIGKAAAIAQITINTSDAAMSGYKWGMAVGGPPLAMTFAGLAVAAGAAQAAKVAGVELADGGIVKATPGGIQATIGEGGKDEAVIPLENGQIPGSGSGQVIVNFNGPIMGDESQAMEFARAIDKQLLKLRQTNQSVAFETDIF